MTLRALIAALHFLALGIGLGAILDRARSLRAPLGEDGLRRVFRADMFWGLAALLWIGTGIWRAFGGLEKGTDYYLAVPAFHIKMGLLALVLLLELYPMITLVRWRIRLGRGAAVDTTRARAFATISFVQAALIVIMVFVAAAMARG